RYLERALDAWVLKTARTYRGFRQVEDEIEAARLLMIEMMLDPAVFNDRRSLAVRLVRSLPYGENSGLADQIRALASEIGDSDSAFAQLRFKIHAMPEPSDIAGVDTYLAAAATTGENAEKAKKLAAKMRRHYDPVARLDRLRSVRRWVRDPPTQVAIDAFVATKPDDAVALVDAGLDLIETAEYALTPSTDTAQGERNLLLLHIMALVEELWIGITADLATRPLSRQHALEVALKLTRGARVLGYLSAREQETVTESLVRMQRAHPEDFVAGLRQATRVLEWGRARLLADFGLPLSRYRLVEPRAMGIIDDILRSGVMLPIATVFDRLTSDCERLVGGGHVLLGVEGVTPIMRGENPGLAVGRLRVLTPAEDPAALKRNEIVLLEELPPELPPVAGLITVGSAGSLSHVALLARNLGIPHASVSGDVVDYLRSMAEVDIVLGVSAGRRVVVGPQSALDSADRALLKRHVIRDKPFLEIDTSRLDIQTTKITPLSEISEQDSGVRVGPKAGELGRLRRLFPDRVSDAAVIPFGAFVRHVERQPADGKLSPMAKLRATYGQAATMTPRRAEVLLLRELAEFRTAIATLPFVAGFEDEIDAALAAIGKPGSFGVFVRSDTNVEDLKEFTGAGLNKTVPNVVERDAILQAIRKVWASPFTERSFRWRQQILKNPEFVYPSVILHKTVPSEKSGVLLTTDIETGASDAITVSVSEGVAAVVDGGAPETLVIDTAGTVRLLASSRTATRKLIPVPPAGGVIVRPALGKDPLLSAADIDELRGLAADVVSKMPDNEGIPWDIEFGFSGGKAYLLQIRPLRASRSAATHPFLIALDETTPLPDETIDLSVNVP
ncbi:MAG: PEP/pyruvate-binding domain-containing protein, partial [Myxococcota bacterium]